MLAKRCFWGTHMNRQTMEDALSEEQPTAKRHFSGPLRIFESPYGPAGCRMSIKSHGFAVET